MSGWRLLGALAIVLLVLEALASASANPVTLEKVVVRSYSLDLSGKVLGGKAYVRLTVEADKPLSLVDRTFMVDSFDLEAYGAKPEGVYRDEEYLAIRWADLRPNSRLSLGYVAKLDSCPIAARVKLLVDGREVAPRSEGDYYVVKVARGSIVRYGLMLSNRMPAFNDTRPPVIVAITWVLSPKYLALISADPEPSSVMMLGEDLALTWGIVLEDEAEASVTFRVRALNSWGEVLLPSPKISIYLNPVAQLKTARQVEEELKKSLEGLKVVEKAANLTVLALEKMANALEDLNASLAGYIPMLENASRKAREAAEALRKSSKLAFNAKEELGRALSAVDDLEEYDAKLARYEAAVNEALKALNKLEEVRNKREGFEEELPGLNGTTVSDLDQYLNGLDPLERIRALLLRIKSDIAEAREALAIAKKAKKQASKAAKALEELGKGLGEAADKMEELATALNGSAGYLRRISYNISAHLGELRSRMAQLSKGLEELKKLKVELTDRLEEAKAERTALEELQRLYHGEEPRVVVDGREYRGKVLSDLVEVRLPPIKLYSRGEVSWEEPARGMASEGWGLEYLAVVVISAPIIASAGRAARRRHRCDEILEALDELSEELEEIAKLN